MYLRTEGVILIQKNFQEADRLLTVYTRDYGKVSAIAKGVRRPKSKKSGHTQLGNWCKIFLAKGKNIDIISEVEVKRAFGFEDMNPEKANRIYHFLELVDSLTPLGQRNVQIFSLLVNFLKKVSKGEEHKLLSSVFKIRLLSLLGFFSTKNLKDSNLKDFFKILEQKDFDLIKNEINLSNHNYLKLSQFLDSMIENLTEKKLKTSKFLNG